jgi:hypothetical protein
MTTQVLVYRGHDNVVELQLTRYDDQTRRLVPIDFTPVTRMVLIFDTVEPPIVFDSQAVSGMIDWQRGNGVIRFDITQYALPVGIYQAQLIAFDPAHANGQVVIDKLENPTTFEVREVLSSGLLPPPLPSAGEGVVRTAGETLSALKAVYELDGKVYALDSLDVDHAAAYLGVTTNAVSAGGDSIIQRSGTLDDSSWSWTPSGEVFVGTDGALTQVAPTVGFKLIVGTAASATRINLTLDTPVFL